MKFAGELLVNPVEAIGNTLAGIGNQIGQIGSGINNAGKSQDQAFGGLGADQKRRELAAKLGVDPYTDFEPLQARLQKISQAAAAGGLVVSGAMMAIPGAVGIVVSNAGTSGRVKDSLRDRTAAQLMDMNREKMLAMGLDRATADALLQNRNYTPLDMTSMVSSLEVVPVAGRDDFLRRAVAVNRRDAAVFNRRYTEMVADYHLKTKSIVSFVSAAEFPFNQTGNGTVVGIWPVDALSWTERHPPRDEQCRKRHPQQSARSPRIADFRSGHRARQGWSARTRLHGRGEYAALIFALPPPEGGGRLRQRSEGDPNWSCCSNGDLQIAPRPCPQGEEVAVASRIFESSEPAQINDSHQGSRIAIHGGQSNANARI